MKADKMCGPKSYPIWIYCRFRFYKQFYRSF